MGGFRRRMRRQAREVVRQLINQGVPPREVGRVVEDARVGRVLWRVIEEMEKRLDGGEGKVSVREGLAAIKEIRQMKAAQQKALELSAAMDEAEALEEEIADQEEDTRRWPSDVTRECNAEHREGLASKSGAATGQTTAGEDIRAAG